jgi:predicted nicotinamide N-methyase
MSTLRYRYQTIEFGDIDIHLSTLRNRQEYSDDDGVAARLGIHSSNWSLYGVVWASVEILARLMLEHEIEGKRILEVGCGIGLASLVLNRRDADITATDYHPKAEAFLEENTRLNNGRMIPFVRTGWGDELTELGEFDLIIGSDLVYEYGQAGLLASFVDQHAKPRCMVIILDPGRKHHRRFSNSMIERGYSHQQGTPDDISILTQPARGPDRFQVHRYTRWVLTGCSDHTMTIMPCPCA